MARAIIKKKDAGPKGLALREARERRIQILRCAQDDKAWGWAINEQGGYEARMGGRDGLGRKANADPSRALPSPNQPGRAG